MNAYSPRIPSDNEDAAEAALAHAYSATCNCDACFDTWLAMPPPDAAEQERRARAFSLALAPSGGGELPTDWPKLASDADLMRLSKGQMAFGRAKL